MVKWEYKQVFYGYYEDTMGLPAIMLKNAEDDPEIDMAFMGEQGWELVVWHSTPTGPMAIYKRPKIPGEL